MKEIEPRPSQRPMELPSELAEFLRGTDMACVMQETSIGTIFVMKLPGAEIESLRGTFPIQVVHELYAHEQAPVIRTLFRFYDKPQSPLAIETFTNVADEVQRADFADLGNRDRMTLAFYDEAIQNRLNKVVTNPDRHHIPWILSEAQGILERTPAERFDFNAAKADVVRIAKM